MNKQQRRVYDYFVAIGRIDRTKNEATKLRRMRNKVARRSRRINRQRR